MDITTNTNDLKIYAINFRVNKVNTLAYYQKLWDSKKLTNLNKSIYKVKISQLFVMFFYFLII